MKSQYQKCAAGTAIVGALLMVGSVNAGNSPGFCAGVTPPAPDALEPNNTFETAIPFIPYQELPATLTFDSDTDEDWFLFRGFRFSDFGNLYLKSFNDPPPDNGVFMTTSAPLEGPGIFIRVFRVDRAGLVEVGAPAGTPGSIPPIDQGCFNQPFDYEFRFDDTNDYAIQVSQCRNQGLDVNSNMVADDEEYCIPANANFGFSINPGIGFQAGELTGTVTDAVTLQPVPLASVFGNTVGLTAFSAPGSGVYSGLAPVVTGGTATVARPGYDSQDVQFDLVQSQTTDCDVALMPSGVSMDSDLSVTMFSIDPAQVAGGDPITINTQVQNSGNGMSPATTLRFYLSTDNSIEPSDTEIGSAAIVGLNAAAMVSDVSILNAPLMGGDFFIGACIDTVVGETNAANNCSSGAPLSIDYLFADSFETLPAPPAGVAKGAAPPACTLL